MASKLQYTYRSAASMSDEMVEYIKTGVENAGSFPKFVDALVAEHMDSGKELDVSAASSFGAAPAVAAKVDLSGIEGKIDETRKEILAAILQQVKVEAEPAAEPVAVQPATALAGEISRNDLVSLRRAMAGDILKAKDEEIEKLDELLSAIETIKIQLKEMPREKAVEAASELVEEKPVFAERKPSFSDHVGRFFGEVKQAAIPAMPSEEDETTAEDLEELPFDDDDFVHGIGDLIGIDYVAQAEQEDVVEQVADDVIEDEYDDENYEYDEDTLAGARVLLGMA